jgi:small subunit ribosomal protein S9
MADEPQDPENEQTPAEEAAALAEHRAVPTEDATEIAGSAEDAALEAFEEAHADAESDADAESAATKEDEPVASETEPEDKPEPVAQEPASVAQSTPDAPAAAQAPVGREAAAAEPASAPTPAAEPAAETGSAESPAETPAVAEAGVEASPEPVVAAAEAEEEDVGEEEEEPAPRVKPAVPGAHLEVDIVPEGVDPLGRDVVEDPYAIEDETPQGDGEVEEEDKALPEPISTAAIDLAAGARYRATGKRKTAIARVILRPGSGSYTINGRPLDAYFPRATLQRNIRQPLETVGYEERMDVVARLHGGGVSAQAGALRHGISRALLEADPNLRGELKRRGFLTRDSRAKERKKAGLKKARKRPQFSKR